MMNSEVYQNVLLANLQRNKSNLIGSKFIMWQDNSLKHTSNSNTLHQETNIKNWPIYLPDFNPIKQHVTFLGNKNEGKIPQNKQA